MKSVSRGGYVDVPPGDYSRRRCSAEKCIGSRGIEHDECAVSGPEKAVRRCVRVRIVSADGTLGAYAHRGGAIGEAGKARGAAGTSKRGKGSRSRCVQDARGSN